MKILPAPAAIYPLCARVHTPTGGIIFYTSEEAAEWLDTLTDEATHVQDFSTSLFRDNN